MSGQDKCATDIYKSRLCEEFPSFYGRLGNTKLDTLLNMEFASEIYENAILYIPVVFHVVYNTNSEKIPQERVIGQLQQLNNDFRGRNLNIHKIPDDFRNVVSKDAKIEFYLATVDPLGNQTSGITWTYTSKSYFKTSLCDTTNNNDNLSINQPIKSKKHGQNAWPANKYLNIWIGDVADQNGYNTILGYAAFPGGPLNFDGVVIDYESVWNEDQNYFNLGRTLTHEVGHWLNLKHLWGDSTVFKNNCAEVISCGIDDGVDDTPIQTNKYSSACPNHNNASSCDCKDMYMNFMGYAHDSCMAIFTKGQVQRMRKTLFSIRKDILANNKNPRLKNIIEETFSIPIFNTFYKKNEDCNSDTCRYNHISWNPIENEERYIVKIKTVASSEWESIETKNNSIKMKNLKEGVFYELEIHANSSLLSDKIESYIFKIGADSKLKDHPTNPKLKETN